MILTMDIGNTNIKIGVFDGKTLREYWRLATKKTYTSDELGVLLCSLFENRHLDRSVVSGIMLSSVVPSINFTVEHMCRDYFGIDPVFVAPGIKTGVDIRYENSRELGSDRICNAVGTLTEYGAPAIFIDFGTATTFGVLDREGAFLGGVICPGIRLFFGYKAGAARCEHEARKTKRQQSFPFFSFHPFSPLCYSQSLGSRSTGSRLCMRISAAFVYCVSL